MEEVLATLKYLTLEYWDETLALLLSMYVVVQTVKPVYDVVFPVLKHMWYYWKKRAEHQSHKSKWEVSVSHFREREGVAPVP